MKADGNGLGNLKKSRGEGRRRIKNASRYQFIARVRMNRLTSM
jgi:hypothetical protein